MVPTRIAKLLGWNLPGSISIKCFTFVFLLKQFLPELQTIHSVKTSPGLMHRTQPLNCQWNIQSKHIIYRLSVVMAHPHMSVQPINSKSNNALGFIDSWSAKALHKPHQGKSRVCAFCPALLNDGPMWTQCLGTTGHPTDWWAGSCC